MTTKITWTHVDAHVRRQCELVGMLPIGANDAEVAYNYLKYVESKADLFQQEGGKMEEECDRLKAQLRALEAKPAKVGKTKQRLAALEKAVTELQKAANKSLTDIFGPLDADGWYAWNGEDAIRPAGRVEYVCRCEAGHRPHKGDADGLSWAHSGLFDDIVKWRPAQ